MVVISPSSSGLTSTARAVDLHAGDKLDGPESRLLRQAMEPHLATQAVQLPDDVQKCRPAGMIRSRMVSATILPSAGGGRFIERLGMIGQQRQDLPAALFQPAVSDGRMLGARTLPPGCGAEHSKPPAACPRPFPDRGPPRCGPTGPGRSCKDRRGATGPGRRAL